MAVKVVQLEGLLQGKQAELQRMGDTGKTWVQDACRLRDAVASTLAALGRAPSCFHVDIVLCARCRFRKEKSRSLIASTLAALEGLGA